MLYKRITIYSPTDTGMGTSVINVPEVMKRSGDDPEFRKEFQTFLKDAIEQTESDLEATASMSDVVHNAGDRKDLQFSYAGLQGEAALKKMRADEKKYEFSLEKLKWLQTELYGKAS